MDLPRGAPKTKIWYQSTLDFAQHPNYAKALAAHFRKIAPVHGPRSFSMAELAILGIIYPPPRSSADPSSIRALSIRPLFELYWRQRRRTLSLLPSASLFFQSYVVWQRSQWSQCRGLVFVRRQRAPQRLASLPSINTSFLISKSRSRSTNGKTVLVAYISSTAIPLRRSSMQNFQSQARI